MLVGLIGIDEGSISVCGSDVTKDFEKALANVGGIVENPEMYRYMTGYQNLKQYARMRKVVELVGLSNRIHEKVSKYSLGMRQRLGVAQALLHHPKVLVLDEPTNGLDPAGIRQLRDILRNLAHTEDICVLVSSHLMSEMQLMCDRVAILVKGKLIQTTTVEELVNAVGGGKGRYRYHISDAETASVLLAGNASVKLSPVDSEHMELQLLEGADENTLAQINRLLISQGVELYTAAPVETQRLEDAFIELTKGDAQIA